MLSKIVDKETIIDFNVEGEIPFLCSILCLLYLHYRRPNNGLQTEPKHVAVNKMDKNLCVPYLGCE
jgi:hypothetical protein